MKGITFFVGQESWKTHIDTQRKRSHLYSGHLEIITMNVVEYTLTPFLHVNDFVFTLDSQTQGCTDSVLERIEGDRDFINKRELWLFNFMISINLCNR